MRLITLAFLAVQLVCIAMGYSYDIVINKERIASDEAIYSEDYFNDDGNSTIAPPETSINSTISFPTLGIQFGPQPINISEYYYYYDEDNYYYEDNEVIE